MEPEQTKTDEARILPLIPEIVSMLRQMEPKTGRVFDATNLRKEWVKGCVTAGLGSKIEVPEKPYDPQYDGLTFTIYADRQCEISEKLAFLRA